MPLRAVAAAGGSNVTPVSFTATPVSEAVSSYGNGQTIVGGLFAGFKVRDASTRLTTLSDNGTSCAAVVAVGGSALTSGDAVVNNVLIYYPTLLMGDVDLQVKTASPGNTSFNRTMGIVLWHGDTAGKSSFTGYDTVTFGSTSAYLHLRANAGTAGANDTNSTALTTEDLTWRRLLVVGETVSVWDGGTGAEPSWVQFGSDSKLAAHGGAFRAGVVMYSNNAGAPNFAFGGFRLTGFEYTATP